jgi:pimeloyl-ACP methyl ester carboxylesterase
MKVPLRGWCDWADTVTVNRGRASTTTTRRTKSGDFHWPPMGTATWPPLGTFSWPRTTRPWQSRTASGGDTKPPLPPSPTPASATRSMPTLSGKCAPALAPTLIVQRTEDQLTPRHHGLALAETIGPNASIIMIDGGGNRPDVRDPVKFSLMLREFVRIFHERRAASHSQHHPPSSLCSPS